jgi:hypothetical protein
MDILKRVRKFPLLLSISVNPRGIFLTVHVDDPTGAVDDMILDSTGFDDMQAMKLFISQSLNEWVEAAEQCLHTDPPSALPSVVESQNTAGG